MKASPLTRDPEKVKAWLRRSVPLKPGKPLQRRRIRPMSKKKAEQIAREAEVRNAYKAAYPLCEMLPALFVDHSDDAAHRAMGLCTGTATDLHEPWTRAQGGPTDDPRNFAHLCRNCHNWLDTPDGRKWGVAHGFRVAKGRGAAWLAAGGRDGLR